MNKLLTILMVLIVAVMQAQVPHEPMGTNVVFYKVEIQEFDYSTKSETVLNAQYMEVGLSKYRKWITIGGDGSKEWDKFEVQHRFKKDEWITIEISDYDGKPMGELSYMLGDNALYWDEPDTGKQKSKTIVFYSKEPISEYL